MGATWGQRTDKPFVWNMDPEWSFAPVQRDVGCGQYGFHYCYQHFRNKTEQVATLVFEVLLFVATFFLLVFFYCSLYRGVNESPFFSSNRMTKLVTRIVVAFLTFFVLIPICSYLSLQCYSIINICPKLQTFLA